MKKLLFIFGCLVSILLITGILFKVLHWPLAGVLLILAAALFIFVLLPLSGIFFFKKEFSKHASYKFKYIFGFLGIALLLTGFVLKMNHWPGSEITLLLSLVVINFGFLPFLFYRIHKKSEEMEHSAYKSNKPKYIFGLIGVAMILTAFVFKILHLPGANALLGGAAIVINFGFLPFLFYGLYKKSMA